MTRARLKAQAFLDGALREPGYVFVLSKDKDGNDMPGPHRSERKAHDKIDVANDAARIRGEMVDVPLYDVIDESKEPKEPKEPAAPADRTLPT